MALSVKKVSLVLIIVLVLMATELSMGVHCRTIKGSMGEAEKKARVGCDEANHSPTSMDLFAVTSNPLNSGSRSSLKGLAFKLASGPSKKGPGH